MCGSSAQHEVLWATRKDRGDLLPMHVHPGRGLGAVKSPSSAPFAYPWPVGIAEGGGASHTGGTPRFLHNWFGAHVAHNSGAARLANLFYFQISKNITVPQANFWYHQNRTRAHCGLNGTWVCYVNMPLSRPPVK